MPTSYLHDDVFLTSETARKLYHETAKQLPIIDFHTHLPQGEILEDHKFENLWELWLKHDHYKWRLMRGCGVKEAKITGSATPWEKFEAFASIMPLAIGNPVHHWAHFELKRVFGIDLLLNKENAKEIWDAANEQLATDSTLTVQGLLVKFNVELVCTTDDPCDDLVVHQQINGSDIATKTYPTYRPDQAMNVQNPAEFKSWIEKLETVLGNTIANFSELIDALKQRHDHFHACGCRLSDHGIAYSPFASATGDELNTIFLNALNGLAADETQWEAFACAILTKVAAWNSKAGWTMQLHLGPQRNSNSSMLPVTGRDSGFDTMGSWPQTEKLIALLDSFVSSNILGKTIVYNLNSVESEPLCCAVQNFQSCKAPGLVQYGPAWWHLDNVRGIREQMDILTSLGAIGTSVGMLTDSRSFTSYVRHEYYRRLLCQYIGDAAERGEMPNCQTSLSKLIADICYHNPQSYFGWA